MYNIYLEWNVKPKSVALIKIYSQTSIHTRSSSLNLDGQLLHFRTAKHVHYTELL